MIPDDEVERVRDAADIVAIIGEHVKLKRSGGSWRGPCPFHHGKDPNFSIIPGKGYRCFVCGETGTVYTFLQKHLGVDFVTAVRMTAEKSGLELREVDSRTEGPDPRERLWEVVGSAAAFFTNALWQDDRGAKAREYLEQRGIDRAAADRFGLGFAPGGDALQKHLETLGYDAARQLEAGLLVQREDMPGPRARFRERLTFTIWDASGNPVGFGARSLDGREPKYLNSPESPIFSKGRTLYGLNFAKNAIRKDERVLLVEGYFDAMRLMLAGIESVVAPLGTALTEEQAKMVTRYSRNVFLLYDSDKAGLKATFRAGDELLRHRASVRVVTLPQGEDPDTYAASHGRQGIEAQLGAAIDVFERKLQLLERAGWFGDLHRKRRALDRLLPTIRSAADPLTRDLYVSRAAEVAGVSREMLAREASGAPASGRAAAGQTELPVRRTGRDRREGERRSVGDVRGGGSERELVRILLQYRALLERAVEQVGPQDFRDSRARSIFEVLLHMGADAEPQDIAAAIEPDAVELLESLIEDRRGQEDAGRILFDSLAALRSRKLREDMEKLDELIPLTAGEEKDELIRRKQELQAEISAHGGRWG